VNRRSQRDFTACQNIITRIDSYIERSTKHGLATQEDFDKFAKLVRQVKEAVLNAQCMHSVCQDRGFMLTIRISTWEHKASEYSTPHREYG
jgi:hypothetical protein